MSGVRFSNRQEAGRQLADKLRHFKDSNTLVYALPRGGVPLGVEVAKSLETSLGLIVTRKIGHPYNPEYAIGAVSEHGKAIYNMSEIMQVDHKWLVNEEAKLKNEIKRRRFYYGAFLSQNGPTEMLEEKTAIIIDDGIATGYTMMAAIDDLKKRKPKKIIVAIPVVPEAMAQHLEKQVDEVVALERTRRYRGAVGAYYDSFEQVNDSEVLALLKEV